MDTHSLLHSNIRGSQYGLDHLFYSQVLPIIFLSVGYIDSGHSLPLFQLRLLRSIQPGPCGLPFLGYLPFLKRPNDFTGEMTDFSRRYGPCFSIRLGSKLLVFLSDQHLIREAFRQPVFDARPHNAFFNIMKGYGNIVINLVFQT